MTQRGHNFAHAFTLLELIVVMVLVVVIVSIVTPSLSNVGRGRSLGDTADQMVVVARWARTQAITRGITFRLNFDPGGRSYWLTMQIGPTYENLLQSDPSASNPPTNFDSVGEEYGSTFMLPDAVSMSCSLAPQQDGQYIEFRPTGRSDAAIVTLTGAGGQTIDVGNLAATEVWHVLNDDERQQEAALASQPQPPAQSR